MRGLKILGVLLLAIGIFGIIGLFSQLEYVNTLTLFYQNLSNHLSWFTLFYQIVIAISAVLLLISLLMVLFRPVSRKQVIIYKETGSVIFPLHTLESVASSAASEIVPANDIQTSVHLDKHQKAYVQATIHEEKKQQFLTKAMEIQDRIVQAFEQTANIETHKVTVKMTYEKQPILSTWKKQPRVE